MDLRQGTIMLSDAAEKKLVFTNCGPYIAKLRFGYALPTHTRKGAPHHVFEPLVVHLSCSVQLLVRQLRGIVRICWELRTAGFPPQKKIRAERSANPCAG